MKDVRIFVASSKELLPERNALAYFVLAHEDEFAKRGLRVRLSKWEYVDPTMTEERTEDRYLDEMLNCDAVLMLFWEKLGMYTKEEVDTAIAAEVAGTSRIKRHLMLFKEGDADESPELAAWRASLAEGTYGTFTDAGGLGAHFLRFVEQIAGLPLQDVADAESEKTISAFLAVDDELAVDRDAFADAVLNLNDVLSHRGARVHLRFYDPEQHRDMLDNSEMALVLYQTKCGAFGTSALKESYDRAKEEKNPRRLYVFLRDAAGKPLDADFQTFKDGFAEAFGSSPCRFENVDTLSLNFLFALESVLGDGAGTFVRLDGRTVVADGLEVGDLTKLPMLEKNTGIADLFSRMEDVSKRFVAQREKCDKNPQDDGLYVELLDLSAEKNRLQDQIDRELKMSFNLAKRLAAISIAQVNETIARARAKVEEGDIKGALEILDSASSALKRRRLLHKAADRAEAEELQIKELKASAEIEYFRVDAVMAYTAMPFEERFKKVVGIYDKLEKDVNNFQTLCTTRNASEIAAFHAGLLLRYAKGYELVNDSISPVKILNVARNIHNRFPLPSLLRVRILIELGRMYASNEEMNDADQTFDEAEQLIATQGDQDGYVELRNNLIFLKATNYHNRGDLQKAERLYVQLLDDLKKTRPLDRRGIANVLANVAALHQMRNDFDAARAEEEEALSCLEDTDVKKAKVWSHLAILESQTQHEAAARKAYDAALVIYERLAQDNPVKYDFKIARLLSNYAILDEESECYDEAEDKYRRAYNVFSRMTKQNRRRFLFFQATAELNLAIFYTTVGKIDDAERFYQLTLQSHTELFQTDPVRHLDGLALVHSNIAILYRDKGDFVLAEQQNEQALMKYLELERRDSARYSCHVARSFYNAAQIKKEMGEISAALENAENAVERYRELNVKLGGTYDRSLKNAINLAVLLKGLNNENH